MIEQWRPLPGFNGYEASNFGRIRSLPRSVSNNGGSRKIAGCIISQWRVKSTGYFQAELGGKRVYSHRIIALAWCEGYFDGAHVDHINGDRGDNRPCNLEWVTPSENHKRSYRNGRVNPFKGSRSGEHPTSKAVISRCLETGEVTHWRSAMDAVRHGFSSDGISRCCTGKIASHKGHEWRFAREVT
jgi:hypothetical protein